MTFPTEHNKPGQDQRPLSGKIANEYIKYFAALVPWKKNMYIPPWGRPKNQSDYSFIYFFLPLHFSILHRIQQKIKKKTCLKKFNTL